MYGIACVIVNRKSNDLKDLIYSIDRMSKMQEHRGPDDAGKWIGEIGQFWIGLGHQRLAIIDLSLDGRQPMVSSCGRYILAYNGELYNI